MASASLSNKEQAALELFKEAIKDEYDNLDDYTKHDLSLLRFLRARDLNVSKAEDMFRKQLQWRKDNKVDEILSMKVSDYFIKTFPYYLSGYDEDGCYINIVPFGRYNYKRVVDDGKSEELKTFTIFCTERAFELMKYKTKVSGKYVNQAFIVSDWDGFSFRNLGSTETMQLMKEMTLQMENNYPEILKCCVIINAPKVFEVIFNLMKPLLSKATLAKIQIFGSNSTAWRDKLRELLPPDQFPSHYGGANTSCSIYELDMGYDLTPKLVTLPEDEMETEVVPAGQKFTVSVTPPTAGMRLCWNFKTEHYDIGFSLKKQNADDEESIFQVAKCDSHIVLQKGVLECQDIEEYVLTFDNSYSKFRSKNLRYVVKFLDA